MDRLEHTVQEEGLPVWKGAVGGLGGTILSIGGEG